MSSVALIASTIPLPPSPPLSPRLSSRHSLRCVSLPSLLVQVPTSLPKPVFNNPFELKCNSKENVETYSISNSNSKQQVSSECHLHEPPSPRAPIPTSAIGPLRIANQADNCLSLSHIAMASKAGTDNAAIMSVEELTRKTRWIRDDLEPAIARNGSRHLAPDTVLELHSFFNNLVVLTHASEPPTLSITKEALSASRVHRAILLITGRGTRWPGKLIEICDGLVTTWTSRFGPLDMIRPELYGKGARLEKCSEERLWKRHELMIKWMGDPNSHVSPLRAQETGHLDFRPGHWWIHPIFAFHAGIIDSPDPHGGITVDGDGAYAILLTANDEITALSPEIFTYRCHNDDKGRFRLIAASLPPKNSIRVLRSHTLRSPWSPPAGVRYDGLYKIGSWALRRVNNNITYEVSFTRELDQVSMREVRLHPNAEEVDDYIEYKRLREARHTREESERRAAMTPSEIEAEEQAAEETQAQDEPKILPLRRRYTSRTSQSEEPPSPLSKATGGAAMPTPLQSGLQAAKSSSRLRGSVVYPASPTSLAKTFDGNSSTSDERRPSIRCIPIEESPLAVEIAQSKSRRGSAATVTGLTRVRFCDEMTDAEIRQEQLAWTRKDGARRKDSAHFSRSSSKIAGSVSSPDSCISASSNLTPGQGLFDGGDDGVALVKGRRQSSTISACLAPGHRRHSRAAVPDHKTLQHLSHNVHDLRAVTLRKDSIGATFMDDLKSMSRTFEEWQLDCAEGQGFVDSCLKQLERDVAVMKCHGAEKGKWDWEGFCGHRGTGPVSELERLEDYVKRYEQRVREELAKEEEDYGNSDGKREGSHNGERVPSEAGVFTVGENVTLGCGWF